jgi:hypothetical protein
MVFVNGKLKKHREQVLFDQERALLPATQPIVERRIITEKFQEELRNITAEIHKLREKRNRLETEMYRTNQVQQTNTERNEFIRACPDGECRGFLSSQWKCGICQKWACPQCHEIKGFERDVAHECNPETLATARLISSDTRPCPKCGTGIFRVSGCDQMFCTQCHTGFNWRTGRVETNIHNPHYFEWIRRNGNQPPADAGINPCGNGGRVEISHRNYVDINNLLRNNIKKENPLLIECNRLMSNVVRNATHLRYVILPRYDVRDRMRRNEELRIRYMRNQITEEEFKIMLQRNQKRIDKYTEMHNVLEILLTTVSEIIYRFTEHLSLCRDGNWNMQILNEINAIVDYTNECLQEISKTYSSKGFRFNYEVAEIR